MLKKPLALLLFLLFTQLLRAQEPSKDASKEYQVFDIEKAPEFPGGEQAMMQFLAQNIKYPALAKENGITGTVAVTFVVNPDGSVSDVTIVRDIGAGCGKELARVVKMMPNWTPGQADGRPVKVRYTLPTRFRLDDDDGSATSATFPGGVEAMNKYFADNLKYPKKALQAKTEGHVTIQGVVGANGNLQQLTVLQGLGKDFDKEALRLVKKMPKWTPKKVNSRPVADNVVIEVPFSLSKKE